MKNLATAYTYDPVAKTITLTGLNVPLSCLLLIVNATRGQIVYNLADPALAAANYTQAANSVLTLNASVSTAFHNPSDSLTIFYDDGIQTNTLLIQGPAGPKGDQGDPGSTAWAGITDKPATFAPSAHKSTHATGGSDALTPEDIGAQYAVEVRPAISTNQSEDILLTAGRNFLQQITSYAATNINVTLPVSGVLNGDIVKIHGRAWAAGSLILRSQQPPGSPFPFNTFATIPSGGGIGIYTFIAVISGSWANWQLVAPDTHTHAIADTTGLQAALDGKAVEGFSEGGSVEKAAMLWDTAYGDKALELRDGEGVFIAPRHKQSFRNAIGAPLAAESDSETAESAFRLKNATNNGNDLFLDGDTVGFVEEEFSGSPDGLRGNFRAAIDAASTSALAALEARVAALEAASTP